MDEEEISIDLILRLNLENYLRWLFEVKKPTEFDRDSFPLWRKQSFDMQYRALSSVYEGSPLPFDEIQKREINRVAATIEKLYYPTLFHLVKGNINDDLYLLGMLFGCIDYMQKLHAAKDWTGVVGASIVNGNTTHRIAAIVHKYKVSAGICEELTRAEMRSQGGKNREKAFDSLNKGSKKVYKPITSNELELAIKLLSDYPNAKKAAQNDLDNLEKS